MYEGCRRRRYDPRTFLPQYTYHSAGVRPYIFRIVLDCVASPHRPLFQSLLITSLTFLDILFWRAVQSETVNLQLGDPVYYLRRPCLTPLLCPLAFHLPPSFVSVTAIQCTTHAKTNNKPYV